MEKVDGSAVTYKVPVCRTGYSFKTIEVTVANSQEEANRLALDMAGNYEFSESNAEYSLQNETSEDKDYLIMMLKSNPELAAFLYNLINATLNYDLREIITAVKGKEYNRSVDTARPACWTNQLRDEMRLKPLYMVWDYNDNKIGGEPFNVAAEVLNKLSELVQHG